MKPRPHAPSDAPPPGEASPSDAARRRRIASRRLLQDSRILVWEHSDTLPIVGRLTGLGCTVVSSHSIEQALAQHGAKPFALLFASPGLEGATELAVLQLLRRALPKIPLVLVSGEATLAVRIRCQELRPQYFAAPPIEDAELRAILRLALSRRVGSPRA